ncbi:MAG: DUF4114 domain-containing protein [Scytonematopsis contorta HA4267-MV1]|jgi:hypothetical protein|nr:DUF4114 domain-containing protein [Scytonematopsis contorta HA4267-MV1]
MITNKLLTVLLAATTLGASLLTAATPANAFTIKGRDEAPAAFKDNIQDFSQFVGKEARYLEPEKIGAQRVDLSRLLLKFDHNVSVFFVGETAGGYRNRLDFLATGKNGATTTGKIFGDTSCSTRDSGFTNFTDFCQNPNEDVEGRSKQDSPLNVGDFVTIGNFKAGTKLDFLLHSNDINGGIYGQNKEGQTVKGIFSLDDSKNPDGMQHTMGYLYKNFLILGYEDLWGGGDKDYNDTVFAIDIGKANAQHFESAAVPEPSVALGLLGVSAIGFLKNRRRLSAKK